MPILGRDAWKQVADAPRVDCAERRMERRGNPDYDTTVRSRRGIDVVAGIADKRTVGAKVIGTPVPLGLPIR